MIYLFLFSVAQNRPFVLCEGITPVECVLLAPDIALANFAVRFLSRFLLIFIYLFIYYFNRIVLLKWQILKKEK